MTDTDLLHAVCNETVSGEAAASSGPSAVADAETASIALTEADEALQRHDPHAALQLLAALPPTPDVAFLRGRAFFRLGIYTEAAHHFQAASPVVGPHALATFHAEAVSMKRRSDMIVLLKEARRRVPEDVRLLDLQGSILMELGRLDEAVVFLQESLRRRPDNENTLNSLAMVLMEQGRFDEAIHIMEDLRARAPGYWAPLCNLACILTNIGRLEDATNLYREAIALAPGEPALRLNHSIAMLKAGRMMQGWIEHEWRFGLPGHTQLPRDKLLPNMTPDLDLKGKRVLVTQEEGLGDTLMYLRYIPGLVRTGAHVHIWGPRMLTALCERIDGVAEVQTDGATPPFDFHCPFISLPRVFAASPQPMGTPVPYLRADPIKVEQWRRTLRQDRKLRVGLVWAGASRPEDTVSYMLDRQRSLRLATLAPLAGLGGVSFYSLQKDDAAQQLPDFPGPIANYMPLCFTMDDTAALISALDVVVSVDTSMVHLAGALGKPVIMMDRVNNCWRWQYDREDSPWYPAMRIVRQKHFQDWSDVVHRVRTLLERAVTEGVGTIPAPPIRPPVSTYWANHADPRGNR